MNSFDDMTKIEKLVFWLMLWSAFSGYFFIYLGLYSRFGYSLFLPLLPGAILLVIIYLIYHWLKEDESEQEDKQ